MSCYYYFGLVTLVCLCGGVALSEATFGTSTEPAFGSMDNVTVAPPTRSSDGGGVNHRRYKVEESTGGEDGNHFFKRGTTNTSRVFFCRMT